MKGLTLYQTKKYDVNQKIIDEIANLESRAILFSIIRQFHTAADISRKNKIPMSTVYKKLRDLEALSLVYAKEIKSPEMDPKTKYYKSRIRGANISISGEEPELLLIKNKNVEPHSN